MSSRLFTFHWAQLLREGLALVSVAIAAFLVLSMASYHHSDPSWSHFVVEHPIANAGGRVGAWLADFLLYLLGYLAYSIPFLLLYATWLMYREPHEIDEEEAYWMEHLSMRMIMISVRFVGFLFATVAAAGFSDLYLPVITSMLPYKSGGIVGQVVGSGMLSVFNQMGGSLLLALFFLVGTTLMTGLSWFYLFDRVGSAILAGCSYSKRVLAAIPWKLIWQACCQRFRERREAASDAHTGEAPKQKPKNSKRQKKKQEPGFDSSADIERPLLEPKSPVINLDTVREKFSKAPQFSNASGIIPELSLLDAPKQRKGGRQLNTQLLEQRSREVELRLSDFGVDANVVAVYPGPVVTRFELSLSAGTKVSKVTGLAKDLARSLSVVSVRVVEVIPGKSVIGIELPNETREVVTLQEVLASEQYIKAHSALTLGLGKDIAGHPVVVDLAKMPHLLVAGTTGSGKSVSLNAMLLSLLYKATPKQLRLIMIDPKMLELAVYEGIPHLLTPVVTDMKDAASALRWCVAEMERRYRVMASLGVRNIAGYNEKVQKALDKGKPLPDPLFAKSPDGDSKVLEVLPQIVVLADEFADMMVVVGKKVETLIARLAQKARAAGIHLIFATQRPSVDVITGLIKANIPTRIAFQVSSKIDSRTILDQQGAEQLLGHGDMLYLAPGTGVPVRIHGAYVGDDEVHRVVKYLKDNGEPEYLDDILSDDNNLDLSGYTDAAMAEGADAEQDPLYDEVVHFVAKARRVSVSSVQRRFKIGYNRAARIVEAMEKAGVVSGMENGGSREVLIPAPQES